MTNESSCYESFLGVSENRRLLRQEELIIEVTEALADALRLHRITRTELAQRLGRSKGFVSQLLSGGRNLTLRTVADVADALGYRVRVGLDRADARTRPVPTERHQLDDLSDFKCERRKEPSFRTSYRRLPVTSVGLPAA